MSIVSKLDTLIRTGEDCALVRINPIRFASEKRIVDAGEIYVSEDVYNFPGVRETIADCNVIQEQDVVKGVSEKLRVYKISGKEGN
jgi:hypothetical protein